MDSCLFQRHYHDVKRKALSKIWTHVADFSSNNDNRNDKYGSG